MKPGAPRAVQLFTTCLIETLRPEAGMAVVRVLESLGVDVHVPSAQTCCGQPAFNAGAWDAARTMGRYTLEVLSKSDLPVVLPSGSCGDMIVHHYPELFESDARYGPLARDVAARTHEFSQFLVEVLDVTLTPPEWQGRVAYHPSCHLTRGLKVTHEPRRLLAGVSGAEVVAIPGEAECCGFGGLFAIKMGEISSAMLERKMDAIESTGASTVVGCDVSCLLHIGGGLHRRGSSVETCHLAELLDPARAPFAKAPAGS